MCGSHHVDGDGMCSCTIHSLRLCPSPLRDSGEGSERVQCPSGHRLQSAAVLALFVGCRCAEVYGRCSDQGLRWTGWTEDHQRAFVRVTACGCISGRSAHHECSEWNCGPGEIFAHHAGVSESVQCQQGRDADDGIGICISLHRLSPHPPTRFHIGAGQLQLLLIQDPQGRCHLRLQELVAAGCCLYLFGWGISFRISYGI